MMSMITEMTEALIKSIHSGEGRQKHRAHGPASLGIKY